MLVQNGILSYRYDEDVQPGKPRLGRHLELDARSLAYLAESEPELAKVQITPREWVCPLPILDQGQLGSCVGNAGTEALAALYAPAHVPEVWDGAILNYDDAVRAESFAVELYHEATVMDGFKGTYPPDDTGSSGLGACRALKKAGLISRYTWATNLHAIGLAFQRGGVLIGMPWLNAFYNPDAHGFIDSDPNWQNSGVAGGHELYAEALETWDDTDPSKVVIRLRNHWRASWGDHGYGRMRGSTYMALRQQVDVKQLVR